MFLGGEVAFRVFSLREKGDPQQVGKGDLLFNGPSSPLRGKGYL